jgi:hypothetical protein
MADNYDEATVREFCSCARSPAGAGDLPGSRKAVPADVVLGPATKVLLRGNSKTLRIYLPARDDSV